MKKLLFVLLTVFSISAFSQNAAKAPPFEKVNETLDTWKNEQLVIQTNYLTEDRITKARFDDAVAQINIQYYEKKIALYKKYGKANSELKLKLSQEKLKLSELRKPSY